MVYINLQICGDSYAVQSTTPNILDGSQDGSTSGGQGWYDLTLAVDPANENITIHRWNNQLEVNKWRSQLES
jgi:hypothetical protein